MKFCNKNDFVKVEISSWFCLFHIVYCRRLGYLFAAHITYTSEDVNALYTVVLIVNKVILTKNVCCMGVVCRVDYQLCGRYHLSFRPMFIAIGT